MLWLFEASGVGLSKKHQLPVPSGVRPRLMFGPSPSGMAMLSMTTSLVSLIIMVSPVANLKLACGNTTGGVNHAGIFWYWFWAEASPADRKKFPVRSEELADALCTRIARMLAPSCSNSSISSPSIITFSGMPPEYITASCNELVNSW